MKQRNKLTLLDKMGWRVHKIDSVGANPRIIEVVKDYLKEFRGEIIQDSSNLSARAKITILSFNYEGNEENYIFDEQVVVDKTRSGPSRSENIYTLIIRQPTGNKTSFFLDSIEGLVRGTELELADPAR
jgi:hypothetical protein